MENINQNYNMIFYNKLDKKLLTKPLQKCDNKWVEEEIPFLTSKHAEEVNPNSFFVVIIRAFQTFFFILEVKLIAKQNNGPQINEDINLSKFA